MKMPGDARWTVLGLLFLGGMINYLDRSAIGVAAPFLAKQLSLSPSELGWVFSVFFFGYAAFCFVGGYASDRIGARNVFAVAAVVWSVFCGLTAFVFSYTSLLIVRVIFGMGEGPYGSATNKMVSNWFPRRQQASAVGWANAGTPLGGAIAGPIVGFIALTYGWRVSFVVIALIGLCWAVAWMLLVTDRPEQNVRVSAAERAAIAADPVVPAAGPRVNLGRLLVRPGVLATAFAFFGYAYILYFFLSWFPSYLTMQQHLSIKSMSFVGAIPWFLGFTGLAGGGMVSDAIYRFTGNAVLARKLLLVGGCDSDDRVGILHVSDRAHLFLAHPRHDREEPGRRRQRLRASDREPRRHRGACGDRLYGRGQRLVHERLRAGGRDRRAGRAVGRRVRPPTEGGGADVVARRFASLIAAAIVRGRRHRELS